MVPVGSLSVLVVITAIGDAPSVPSLWPWISSAMVSTFVGLSEPDKSLNIFLQIKLICSI